MAVGGTFTPGGPGGGTYRAPGPVGPPGFKPPPIPPGFYNPEYDVQMGAQKLGSEQTEHGLERQGRNARARYGVNTEQLKQTEANQLAAHNQVLARLKESYSKLAGRQSENTNRLLGSGGGGALLASAAKRAANEGVQVGQEATRYGLQQQADVNQLGNLGLTLSEGQEGLGESLSNTQATNLFNTKAIEEAEGKEAADRGYNAPDRNPQLGVPMRPIVAPHVAGSRVGGSYVTTPSRTRQRGVFRPLRTYRAY